MIRKLNTACTKDHRQKNPSYRISILRYRNVYITKSLQTSGKPSCSRPHSAPQLYVLISVLIIAVLEH